MNMISIDGPSKVGKTCFAESLQKDLYGDVRVEVAGNVYRKATVLTLAELGATSVDAEIEDFDLDDAFDAVLDRDFIAELTDAERDWGDLQHPLVSKMVGRVATRPEVDDATSTWYGAIVGAARAANIDTLIVDGRNPRRRIQDEGIDTTGMIDFYLDCDVRVSAIRTLWGRGIEDPSELEIFIEEAALVTRRETDVARKVNPFIVPEHPLVLNEDTLIEDIVGASYEPVYGETLPRTIKIDNTHINKDQLAGIGLQVVAASLFEAAVIDFK